PPPALPAELALIPPRMKGVCSIRPNALLKKMGLKSGVIGKAVARYWKEGTGIPLARVEQIIVVGDSLPDLGMPLLSGERPKSKGLLIIRTSRPIRKGPVRKLITPGGKSTGLTLAFVEPTLLVIASCQSTWNEARKSRGRTRPGPVC